jgi:putative membrane protein
MTYPEQNRRPDAVSNQDPRVAMAAERTFLAWIRTGLALMGFGFVLARFGLFLREMASLQNLSRPVGRGYSLWIGVCLVALGVVVNILAAVNHARYLRALSTSRVPPHLNTWLGYLMTAVLAVIGVVTAVYLLAMR